MIARCARLTSIPVLTVVLLLLAALPARADSTFVTTAEVLISDAATPPREAQGWRPIVLPRSWSRDDLHPDDTHQAWYRITIPPEAITDQYDHVLMLRHMMNLELWVEDRFVGSGGPVREPVQEDLQRNWNRPVLWVLPPLDGARYLYARLISEPNFGVMSPLVIGTGDSLRPWYQVSYFLQISLVKVSLMALALIGCLSFFVWIRTRQTHWWLLAAMSVFWALPLLYIVVPVVPIAEFTALRVSHWGVVAGACALLAFICLHYLKMQDRRLQWLILIPVIDGILLALAPDSRVVSIGNAGQLLCHLLFVVLIVQLLKHTRRTPYSQQGEEERRAIFNLMIGLALMLLAALHDVTLVSSNSSARWRWDTPLSYVVQPVMLMILAWRGVRVFVDGIDSLARANRHLQSRLDASEVRIRQVFAEQEGMEREIRLEAERELVYRDLHDDLGARLLSLVYQSEKGPSQDLARTALQDLRDIVSRVLADQQSLSAVLADCMAEQLNRATVLGKALDWDIADAFDDIACSSVLQLRLRLLLRELIGGCLRQAGVSALRVDLERSGDDTSAEPALAILISLTRDEQSADLAAIPLLPVLQKRLRAVRAVMEQVAHEDARLRVLVPLGIEPYAAESALP
ncbi:MAG: hypothetical protein V4751_09230 [Pseudomonadota bacterium]